MRCRWILAVATVAIALSTGAAAAGHLGSGQHYHYHHHTGSITFGYAPNWGGSSWNPYWYPALGGGYYWPGYFGPQLILGPGAGLGPMAPIAFRGPLAPALILRRQPQGVAAANGAKPPKRKPRVPNATAVARAEKYMESGDANFRAQKFSAAYERYKKAASAAPDVADAHFRQGFSLLAMGKYESANKAFLRGLDVKPDWARSEFRLDQLYGGNRLAKANQLEKLAAAAGDDPRNAGLMFLLGIDLFFDGQGERARKFFIRASDMGENKAHLEGFLDALGPARGAKKAAPKRDARLEL